MSADNKIPENENINNSTDAAELPSAEENPSVAEIEASDTGATEDKKIKNKKKDKKKKNKAVKIILRILLIILIVILVLALSAGIAVAVLYNKGKSSLKNESINITAPPELKEEVTIIDNGAEVYYNGGQYKFNENIVTFLLMGVDKRDIDDQKVPGSNGQADALFLVVADTESGDVDFINISRDAMTNVSIYSSAGSYIRDERMQACLAYAYGKDQESSCQNVIKSVSELMYGIPINSFFSMDLKAIGVLNDSVGGVEVPEYNEDFSALTGKKVTLWGKEAENYVRLRDKKVLDSNVDRMERQKTYIKAFVDKAVMLTKEDITTPVTLFQALDGYKYSDITVDEITYMAINFLDGISNMEMHSIEGTVVKGEKYAEFEVDPIALYEMILDIFYVKIN
ncbi:MAG: LytR family transcriptional regulator [Ruminococcaceae bacterium]|nr:LytR family transcriptional regulator [Oscillospiraceae bacterium]